MKEKSTVGIFPTPIYFCELDREFTDNELEFFCKNKSNTRNSDGNIISANNYILDNPEMTPLKSELMIAVQNYVDNVMCYKPLARPYITQSWLNYTEAGQYHHKHSHPNSAISGVLYINADEETDKIYFYNDNYRQIEPAVSVWNLYNSKTWYFTVKTYHVVLFPSYLTHMVRTKAGNNTRISLAFNTFFRGDIGVNQDLTALKL
jgi:uncharacterized protein (TIGR02466 family)